MSTLSQFFYPRLAGKEYLSKFEAIAFTITNEYIDDVYKFVRDHGYAPVFGDTLEKMQSLTNELTVRAQWMRDEYKEGRGGKASITLTTSCKRVIKGCVADYLQAAKNLRYISDYSGCYRPKGSERD